MSRSNNHFSSLSEEILDPDSDGEERIRDARRIGIRSSLGEETLDPERDDDDDDKKKTSHSGRSRRGVSGSSSNPTTSSLPRDSAQALFDIASSGLRKEISRVNYRTADDETREISTGYCQNFAMQFLLARKKFQSEMKSHIEKNPFEKKKIFELLLAGVSCLAAVGEAYMRISALCVHGEHFDGVAQNWFHPALHHILEAQSESDAAFAEILNSASTGIDSNLSSYKQAKIDELSQSIVMVYEDGKSQIENSLALKQRLSEELAANIAARDEIRAKMAARNKKSYRPYNPDAPPNPFTIEREKLKLRLSQVETFLMEIAVSDGAMMKLAEIASIEKQSSSSSRKYED